MMNATTTALRCPACGAVWGDGMTCEAAFHQMLFWESEDVALGVVHHLMVLCYHLQHPHLMSPAGLVGQKRLLREFLSGVSPQAVRVRDRERLDSGKRAFKIKATTASHGSYAHLISWTMTAPDVVTAGKAQYIDTVRAWAQAVDATLTDSGNYAAS